MFFFPPQHAGVRFRGFSNPTGGKILGVFDFHGGEILGLKKSYGCKKKNRWPKFLVFFWCIIKISGENYFFDLSGSEIFDIYKSGGYKFQRKLKSHVRKIWRLFFLELCLAGF